MNKFWEYDRDAVRVFTEDEVSVIWEEFFGKRYSLAHIAQNFGVPTQRIISVIEREQAVHEKTQRKAHSSIKKGGNGITPHVHRKPKQPGASTASIRRGRS